MTDAKASDAAVSNEGHEKSTKKHVSLKKMKVKICSGSVSRRGK